MTFKNFFTNTNALVKLAFPILIAQLIQTLMGFFDTIMAGQVSATDLAAVALASSVWMPVILTLYGISMALTSIVAQYSGSKNNQKIVNATYQTAFIALSVSLLLVLAFVCLIPIISPMVTIETKLKTLMFDYLLYVVWGAPAFCLFSVLRCYAEGLSFSKPTMVISIIGLLINIPANYIFINGFGSVPALGGAGCGIATALVYWVMLIAMLIYCFMAKKLKPYSLFEKFYRIDIKEIKHILSIGVPIALSLLFEVSLFSVVALIIAPFGANVVASHQIALNFSGIVFMVPLSFAMAVTIRIGYSLGERKYEKAKEICGHSFIFALAVALLTASFSIIFRENIASIYINNPDVIALAASLMFLAALFQFSDAIQVVAAGALRGYKDTTAILIITFISYWVIGLSVGVVLGVTSLVGEPMGPAGFWIGFIVGLSVAAILLGKRLVLIQKRFAKNNENIKQTLASDN